MSRPVPPANLLESLWLTLRPAMEVWEWITNENLAEDGGLHNEDPAHLIDANIGVLWASESFAKQGRVVPGQAEQVMHRAGGWQKARMEQQMREWFGEEPEFIITLAADYCAQCSDAEFCALVEHELYHIAHKLDKCGAPAFSQDNGALMKAALAHRHGCRPQCPPCRKRPNNRRPCPYTRPVENRG